jgi:hypothetical protein
VLGQTDVQVFGAGAGVEDCGTLFSPIAGPDCAVARSTDQSVLIGCVMIAVLSVAGVVFIVRSRPRRARSTD